MTHRKPSGAAALLRRATDLPDPAPLPRAGTDLSEAADLLRAGTVAVVGRDGRVRGAGIVGDGRGTVITSHHVVARAGPLRLVGPDGRVASARLVARDRRADLAVLEAPASGWDPVAFGDPTALRPGHLVLALGHPWGQPNAASFGVVHSLGAEDGELLWIRAHVRLAPGNSGGPLADARGRVVGINALVAGGLGHAVAISRASPLIRELGGALAAAAT